MALISTYYDYELKKEAYKLTGEKGYARSTSTLLELVNVVETAMEYCTATFNVNVLNDRDSSQIVFYDNDVLIPFTYNGTEYTYFEWSNQITGNVTVSMKLTYETTHRLQARYLANKKCSPSKSKTVELYQNRPESAKTTLTLAFGHTNKVYTSSEDVTCTATLSLVDTSLISSANQNQPINFYVDGVLNGSANTDSNGVASYQFSNVSVGLHNITAEYEGSEYLFQSETSTELSRGYKVDVKTYPTYVLNHNDIGVTAKLMDFFENPISSKTITLTKSDLTSLNVSGTTNSSGEVSLTLPYSKYSSAGTTEGDVRTVPYKAKYSSSEYSSEVITKDYANMKISINQSSDTFFTAKNNSLTINGVVFNETSGQSIGIPLSVNVSGAVSNTLSTNNNGEFSVSYVGTGGGTKTLTTSIYGSNATTNIEDYLLYWRANNISWNKQYDMVVGEFREYSNGFKLTSTNGFGSIAFGEGKSFDDDFELSLTVVATSSVTAIGFGEWVSNNAGLQTPQSTSIKNGDKLRIVRANGTIELFKNNSSILSSSSIIDGYPFIIIQGNPTTQVPLSVNGQSTNTMATIANPNPAYLTFDNLTMKVI